MQQQQGAAEAKRKNNKEYEKIHRAKRERRLQGKEGHLYSGTNEGINIFYLIHLRIFKSKYSVKGAQYKINNCRLSESRLKRFSQKM